MLLICDASSKIPNGYVILPSLLTYPVLFALPVIKGGLTNTMLTANVPYALAGLLLL